jgi:hypothetical protein
MHDEPDPLLIILHMPRTGGVSLRRALRGRWGAAFKVLKAEAADPFEPIAASIGPEIRVVQGHMNHGLHAFIERPARYATLLRHPVERTLSHFRLVNQLRSEAGRGPVGLDVFLEQEIAGNLQAEFLAGVFRRADLPEERVFDLAREHLRACAIVGRFDDLERYSRALGLGELRHRNSWGEHPELSSEQEERLRSRTALDLALYELAGSDAFRAARFQSLSPGRWLSPAP